MRTEQIEAIRKRAENGKLGGWHAELMNAREDIPALLAEVERLREALEFYAKRANNDYSLNNAPDWTELIESPVMRDGGVLAKKTLRGDA